MGSDACLCLGPCGRSTRVQITGFGCHKAPSFSRNSLVHGQSQSYLCLEAQAYLPESPLLALLVASALALALRARLIAVWSVATRLHNLGITRMRQIALLELGRRVRTPRPPPHRPPRAVRPDARTRVRTPPPPPPWPPRAVRRDARTRVRTPPPPPHRPPRAVRDAYPACSLSAAGGALLAGAGFSCATGMALPPRAGCGWTLPRWRTYRQAKRARTRSAVAANPTAAITGRTISISVKSRRICRMHIGCRRMQASPWGVSFSWMEAH